MASLYGWNKTGTTSIHLGNSLIFINEQTFLDSGCDFFTFKEQIENNRRKGEYRLKSAVAVLESYEVAPNLKITRAPSLDLVIRFENLRDAQILYDLIRAGKIWPDIDYEDTQVPAPCRHLKDLFKEMFGIIRREVAKKLYFA